MNCLQCLVLNQQQTPAVVVCRDCGAAVCLQHAWISHTPGHPSGLVPGEPASRTLRCNVCAAGHQREHPATDPALVAAHPCADNLTCLC
jgi:hypothetical protein